MWRPFLNRLFVPPCLSTQWKLHFTYSITVLYMYIYIAVSIVFAECNVMLTACCGLAANAITMAHIYIMQQQQSDEWAAMSSPPPYIHTPELYGCGSGCSVWYRSLSHIRWEMSHLSHMWCDACMYVTPIILTNCGKLPFFKKWDSNEQFSSESFFLLTIMSRVYLLDDDDDDDDGSFSGRGVYDLLRVW